MISIGSIITNTEVADSEISINGVLFENVPSETNLNIVVKNEDDIPVGAKIGSEYIVPTAITPSGILLRFPQGHQYTLYRTGDEGDRMQSGYFINNPPTFPKLITGLDYGLGANYWWRLASPAVVNGTSSTIRFVDVNGVQGWSSINNIDCIVIDKLTGIGMLRKWTSLSLPTFSGSWDTGIDNCLTWSIVVDGVTYNNFYMPSLEELQAFFGTYFTRNFTIDDPISSVPIILENSVSGLWTSTTVPTSTANAFVMEAPSTFMRINAGFAKTTTGVNTTIAIFDARSLISAP